MPTSGTKQVSKRTIQFDWTKKKAAMHRFLFRYFGAMSVCINLRYYLLDIVP